MTRDSEPTTWKNVIQVQSIHKGEEKSQDFSIEHAELFRDFFLLRNEKYTTHEIKFSGLQWFLRFTNSLH
jgi:hypothetical protein